MLKIFACFMQDITVPRITEILTIKRRKIYRETDKYPNTSQGETIRIAGNQMNYLI